MFHLKPLKECVNEMILCVNGAFKYIYEPLNTYQTYLLSSCQEFINIHFLNQSNIPKNFADDVEKTNVHTSWSSSLNRC